MASSKQDANDTRISVTVLSGFLGSGKTTLLNRLLSQPRYAKSLVIINEFGDVGVDHALVRNVRDDVVLLAGGCICCTVRGSLVDSLRDMFLQAMQRRIKPFDHVLIETSGLSDVAPVMFTLRHDFFIAERYVFETCVTVVDAVNIEAQLAAHRSAVSQIALADYLVISKTDDLSEAHAGRVRKTISAINPTAQVSALSDQQNFARSPTRFAPELEQRPAAGAAVRGVGFSSPRQNFDTWLGGPSTGVQHLPRNLHGNAYSFAVVHDGRWARARFLSIIDAWLTAYGHDLLRVKGILRFDGAGQCGMKFAFHAVHQVRYPMLEMSESLDVPARCELVFIVSGKDGFKIEQAIRSSLTDLTAPGGAD